MRVIVNQLVALGQRTGIGHYTAQLLRCLPAQAAGDVIDRYPTGWIRRAARMYARLRPLWGGRQTEELPSEEQQVPGQRAWPKLELRRRGWKLVGRHFRATCNRERYDLYHEPNFLPLPTDCPTIATLHDLSVLLHPQWHP